MVLVYHSSFSPLQPLSHNNYSPTQWLGINHVGSPQGTRYTKFLWYNKWTSLDPDGLPDWVIKDSLKQPDQIKISFTMNGKELSTQLTRLNSAPSSSSCKCIPTSSRKFFSCMPVNNQRDGPMLFPLMEQCFQEVNLMEWMNIISVHCPEKDNKSLTISSNASKIISRHSQGSQILVTSWPTGSIPPKSQHSCPCTSTCVVKCSSSATSRKGSFVQQWS